MVQTERICPQCLGLDPRVGKIPWRRVWQPSPVSCLENPHGQRSLTGYSPWGRKQSDRTERLSTAEREERAGSWKHLDDGSHMGTYPSRRQS